MDSEDGESRLSDKDFSTRRWMSDYEYYRYAAKRRLKINDGEHIKNLYYYLVASEARPATVYKDFMKLFLDTLEASGKHEFLRVFLETGSENPASFLVRCLNAYINGVHSGRKLYELGHTDRKTRFFLNCKLTNYREDYYELLGDTPNNLMSLIIGPAALRGDAFLVQRNPTQPFMWRRPISRFAMTFCEPARLPWMSEDLVEAFESGFDIHISQVRYRYMAVLPKWYGLVCNAAEGRLVIDTAKHDPPKQPEDEKKTVFGCRNLKTNSVYARAAFGFKRLQYQGAQPPIRPRTPSGTGHWSPSCYQHRHSSYGGRSSEEYDDRRTHKRPSGTRHCSPFRYQHRHSSYRDRSSEESDDRRRHKRAKH